MHMWWRWVGAGCLAVLVRGLSLAAQAQDCVKTVRWYDDVPYTYRGPDGNPIGLNVDVLQEALSRVGLQGALGGVALGTCSGRARGWPA